MIIHWSDDAIGEIKSRYGEDATLWKLVSDSEGCGCAMNGVAAFWAIPSVQEGELKAQSNAFEVWYEKRHEVFFDERMSVTYQPEHRAFKLASDGQIYSNRLRLEDRRMINAIK